MFEITVYVSEFLSKLGSEYPGKEGGGEDRQASESQAQSDPTSKPNGNSETTPTPSNDGSHTYTQEQVEVVQR